jgi:acetyltransferase-like isoleucine patch superfamily enzyme
MREHIKKRAYQDNNPSWVFWVINRIFTRSMNGLFIVTWKSFFSWVPLIWGRWWRRWFLKIILRGCGKKLNVSTGVHIEYPWRISVGNNVWIGREVQLEGMGSICIGDDVMIAFQSVLQTAGHAFSLGDSIRSQTIVSESITICDDVWIGTRAILKHGVKIGSGAVVAMGAVVVKDVDPFSVVGGVPAIVIGSRNDC